MGKNNLYNPDETSKCALALANIDFKTDSSESYKIDGSKEKSGVFCVACKPGFIPVYSTVLELNYKVVECKVQEFCQSTSWFNLCENC